MFNKTQKPLNVKKLHKLQKKQKQKLSHADSITAYINKQGALVSTKFLS